MVCSISKESGQIINQFYKILDMLLPGTVININKCKTLG
jgi:hypothetical protein